MTEMAAKPLKILSISDVELSLLYCSRTAERFSDVDLVISCGDLPASYLDYISSSINVPLYYVFGNHQNWNEMRQERREDPALSIGFDLHRRCRQFNRQLLIAGVEGSICYNQGPKQYTQFQMWMNIFALFPVLFWNKLRYGRYLDIFVTHASPWKIHDQEDSAHIGIKAFRWFDRVFKPLYHLHGHIHVYRTTTVTETVYYRTRIVNTYGYREILLDPSMLRKKERR